MLSHRSREMKKILAVMFAIIVIIAFSLVVFGKKKEAKNEKPTYKEVKPDRGLIEKSISASGKVTSNLDVEIKCKASGTIISIPFDIGDFVRKGELLLMLDPADELRNLELSKIQLNQSRARYEKAQENLRNSERDLETSRESAEIALKSAEARAELARSNLDRVKELYEKGFASKEELEQAKTNLIASEADVDAAMVKFKDLDNKKAALELTRKDVNLALSDVQSSQISLETAKQRLDDTKVYAPIDGYVTARYAQAGQIISSGISATTGGTTIMKLSDLSRLFVYANVDESDIGQVQIGQNVKINVDAFPRENFKGKVLRIARSGVNVSNVVTFEVRIEVESENKNLLMPEMTADVKIVIEAKDNVLKIPSNAVTRANGVKTVMVANEKKQPVPREVVTGLDNGEFVEIISGISESDIVLLKESAQQSEWRKSGNQPQGPPPVMIPFGPGGRR